MPADTWKPQISGVCTTCAMPLCGHYGERCVPEGEQMPAPMRAKVDAWFAIVRPARDAHRDAKRTRSFSRSRFRAGVISADDLAKAEMDAGRTMAQYTAAIARADKEAAHGPTA